MVEWCITAGSEPVVISPIISPVEKVIFDWKNWADPDAPWRSVFEETYFYGDVSIYNDYNGYSYYGTGDFMTVSIDDNKKASDRSIATQMYRYGELTNIPNVGGYWAFSGLNLNNMRNLADKSKIPDDVWFGVKSLKAYEDTGYAVFTIYSAVAYSPEYKLYSADSNEVLVESEQRIEISEVDLGGFVGKAWDVFINIFDNSYIYHAIFTSDGRTKTGRLYFDNVEADGGSISFAVLLKTLKERVELGVKAQ